jgi:5'-deoxynucleotidase YfbR-like HD superfamily hydrolase
MWEKLHRLFCEIPGLGKTIRWVSFENIREQDSLEHSFSLAVLANVVARLLKPFHPSLDAELIKDTALLHDIGECGQGRDIPYVLRKKSQNREEYENFKRVFSCVKPEILDELKRPFLLQFSLFDHSVFEEEEREILRELKENREKEAKIFEALENLEYIFFAIEQWHTKAHEKICKQILETACPALDKTIEEIEGFDLIWSEDFRDWCQNFIDTHQHIPPQINEREE